MPVLRMVLATAVALAFAAPGIANVNQHDCTILTQQIDHYSLLLERAKQSDNDLWVDRTKTQVSELETKRMALCPEYSHDAQARRAFWEFMKYAAKATAAYFTMGQM